MTAASNSEARKRAAEAASNSESAPLATNSPNRGDDTSEAANGPQIANLRSVLLESLRPFVQCGERYCGTIPGGNARCEDCSDLVATATDLVVGIVERRPQPIPAPVDSGAIGRLNEAERAALRLQVRQALVMAWRDEYSVATVVAGIAECLEGHLADLLREHTDRALAEVESVVASRREAFLPSPNLDPAWIAGWHSAVDDVTNSVRAARQEQGR